MSYNFYIILHLLGIFTLFYALGGIALHLLNGGTRATFNNRRFIMITHGIALLIIFVSAFGLLVRKEIIWPWPIWVWGKIFIWLTLGGVVHLMFKQKFSPKMTYFFVLLLGFLALLLVELKPI